MAMRFQRKAAGRCKGVGSCRRERRLFMLEEERIYKRKVLFRGDLLKAEGDRRERGSKLEGRSFPLL